MAWSLRAAEVADAEALLANVVEAVEGYRSFAPEGWEPPDERARLDHFRTEIARPDAFTLMAEGAGHVHWVPLADGPVHIHLRHLFVRPAFWGTGLARELHAAAVDALGDRSARLFTPAGQARARRFYEREGWRLTGVQDSPQFGMPLAEYRRSG